MKKLYNGKGKRIHPSPALSSPCNFLAALPSALLSLAAALSLEDKEVLFYLLSDGANQKLHFSSHHQRKAHPPQLACGCFSCYKTFWARWNSSPNHLLIHQILDAVEDSLHSQSLQSRRRRRRRGSRAKETGEKKKIYPPSASLVAADVDGDDEGGEEDEEEFEGSGELAGDGGDGRSSVSRFVSFIGERVWGVWKC